MAELLTAAQMRTIEQAAINSGDVTGLELMERAELLPANRLSSIRTEANELTRIFNATRTTTRNHRS